MRCVQDKRFAYIFNGWSDGKTEFTNESTEGLTFRAMVEASEKDADIKERVELFRYRVLEELYDFELDPHALHNLAGLTEYKDILGKMRNRMYEYMLSSQDGLADDFYKKVIKGLISDN